MESEASHSPVKSEGRAEEGKRRRAGLGDSQKVRLDQSQKARDDALDSSVKRRKGRTSPGGGSPATGLSTSSKSWSRKKGETGLSDKKELAPVLEPSPERSPDAVEEVNVVVAGDERNDIAGMLTLYTTGAKAKDKKGKQFRPVIVAMKTERGQVSINTTLSQCSTPRRALLVVADAVLLCFDPTLSGEGEADDSLKLIEKVWLPAIREAAPTSPILLCATRVERVKRKRSTISPTAAVRFAKEAKLTGYFEVSVRNNMGVKYAIERTAEAAMCAKNGMQIPVYNLGDESAKLKGMRDEIMYALSWEKAMKQELERRQKQELEDMRQGCLKERMEKEKAAADAHARRVEDLQKRIIDLQDITAKMMLECETTLAREGRLKEERKVWEEREKKVQEAKEQAKAKAVEEELADDLERQERRALEEAYREMEQRLQEEPLAVDSSLHRAREEANATVAANLADVRSEGHLLAQRLKESEKAREAAEERCQRAKDLIEHGATQLKKHSEHVKQLNEELRVLSERKHKLQVYLAKARDAEAEVRLKLEHREQEADRLAREVDRLDFQRQRKLSVDYDTHKGTFLKDGLLEDQNNLVIELAGACAADVAEGGKVSTARNLLIQSAFELDRVHDDNMRLLSIGYQLSLEMASNFRRHAVRYETKGIEAQSRVRELELMVSHAEAEECMDITRLILSPINPLSPPPGMQREVLGDEVAGLKAASRKLQQAAEEAHHRAAMSMQEAVYLERVLDTRQADRMAISQSIRQLVEHADKCLRGLVPESAGTIPKLFTCNPCDSVAAAVEAALKTTTAPSQAAYHRHTDGIRSSTRRSVAVSEGTAVRRRLRKMMRERRKPKQRVGGKPKHESKNGTSTLTTAAILRFASLAATEERKATRRLPPPFFPTRLSSGIALQPPEYHSAALTTANQYMCR